MGKVVDLGKGKLQIIYGGLESPIAGVDARKITDAFLDPNSIANSAGFFSQDGYLSSVYLNPIGQLTLPNPQSPYVVGDVQLTSVTQTNPYIINKYSYGFIAVSAPSALQIYEYANGLQNGLATNIISISANQASTLTYYVVNGVVYITGLGFGAIYAYTPIVGGVSTLTQLTNYVGGAYLGELNGRLLCLCCDAINAGVYSYSPFQISWSAATGNYSQWNPLVGGLVTGAGYNNLPDVADEITGFFSVGPTGYIVRKQGITEMTPLNSGIQPFDFNHMWASNKGIGSVFPNTVKQYGSLGGFLSDTGVYTLGYGGINTIHGNFWGEIVPQLQQFFNPNIGVQPSFNNSLSQVSGAIAPINIASEINLHYILYIPGQSTANAVLFTGNILTQEWNIIGCFSYSQVSNNIVKIAAISNSAIYNFGADTTIAIVSAVISGKLTLFTINDTYNLPAIVNVPFPGLTPFVYFPIEEIGMFKDITVNAIGIYADGQVKSTDSITLSLSITNLVSNPGPGAANLSVTYSPVVLTSTDTFAMSYPPSTGGFSGKYPQLSIQSLLSVTQNSAIRIYKIVLFCTYDAQQVP